jgi:superfamily II DNA or RNA helicase
MMTCRFNLRDYQQECINSIPTEGSYLIQMATGLGKTVTFSRIQRNGRMLILSHREELVKQPRKYFNCSYGIEQGKNISSGEEIVSASVQSLANRLDRFSRCEFDVIIIDEAHHAAAPTYRKIIDYFEPRLLLGFTATPNRSDDIRLDDIFEDIVFQRDLKWGIKNNYLSDIYCLRADIGYDISSVATRMGDFAPGELEETINQNIYNKAIAEAYDKYAIGQTLVFAVSVKHAQDIAKEIRGAVAVTGDSKNRAQIIKDFTDKKIRCLVNCMVFTEGTDLPCIETVIIARPTQSASLYAQMVGRGTRLYPGKEKLTLIDIIGNCGRHNLCTAPTLIGMDYKMVPKSAQCEIEGDLFDLPDKITRLADCPESWIRNIEFVDLWAKTQNYKTHNVNYFKMPNGDLVLQLPDKIKFVIPAPNELGRTEYAGFVMDMQKALDCVAIQLDYAYSDYRPLWDASLAKKSWGRYAASDKQKALIRRKVRDFDTEYLTKFEACQILNRVLYRA